VISRASSRTQISKRSCGDQSASRAKIICDLLEDVPGSEEEDNSAKESLDENLEKTRKTTRRTTTKKMGTDRLRNEKPKTTKNKEKRHQRDEKKTPGSGQPITDKLFQSHSCTNH
jgi:hypothetical protein